MADLTEEAPPSYQDALGQAAQQPPPHVQNTGYSQQPPSDYPSQAAYPPGYPVQAPSGYPQQTAYPMQSYPPQSPPSYPQQPGYTATQQGHVYPQAQQTRTNVTVVTSQPVQTVAVHQHKPDNQLFLSLFAMFFCCFFCGLVALVYSLKVDSAYNSGDYVGSVQNAIQARRWSIVSIVCGMVLIIVVGVAAGLARVRF